MITIDEYAEGDIAKMDCNDFTPDQTPEQLEMLAIESTVAYTVQKNSKPVLVVGAAIMGSYAYAHMIGSPDISVEVIKTLFRIEYVTAKTFKLNEIRLLGVTSDKIKRWVEFLGYSMAPNKLAYIKEV